MVDSVVAAFDVLLQANSCETCTNQQVSIPTLCALLGHNGKIAVITLQKAYRKHAETNNLQMPTMTKRFVDNKSSKAKTSWINVQDAASFLCTRIKKLYICPHSTMAILCICPHSTMARLCRLRAI